MKYYKEELKWKDGTTEHYEVLHRNNTEALEYASKEFEAFPEILEYRVYIGKDLFIELRR